MEYTKTKRFKKLAKEYLKNDNKVFCLDKKRKKDNACKYPVNTCIDCNNQI